jgi:CAAX prenyl protease-like protein
MSSKREILIRVLPFALFILLLALRDLIGEWLGPDFDVRWVYPVKIALVTVLLLYLVREYVELRQLPEERRWLWLWSPLAGAGVFLLWINLDWGWLDLASKDGFVYEPRDPRTGNIDWTLAAFRLAGAALLVPVMEELFWRSFVMRWIDRRDFLALSPALVSLKAILVSSLVFGLEHNLWFAGILAGLAYAWLYRASGSLWPPIVAHAVTNGMLGAWVLHTGQWRYW